MANRKKTKKRIVSGRKGSPKARSRKAKAPKKKVVAKKTRRKVAAPKRAVTAKRAPAKRTAEKREQSGSSYPEPRAVRRSGDQAGDLQGVSRTERADSESVDELVEEGNVFEASAVSGVERAEDNEEREVRTEQFPEDDVPEEYLDKD